MERDSLRASVKMMQSPALQPIGRTLSSMCSSRFRYLSGRLTFALCEPGMPARKPLTVSQIDTIKLDTKAARARQDMHVVLSSV